MYAQFLGKATARKASLLHCRRDCGASSSWPWLSPVLYRLRRVQLLDPLPPLPGPQAFSQHDARGRSLRAERPSIDRRSPEVGGNSRKERRIDRVPSIPSGRCTCRGSPARDARIARAVPASQASRAHARPPMTPRALRQRGRQDRRAARPRRDRIDRGGAPRGLVRYRWSSRAPQAHRPRGSPCQPQGHPCVAFLWSLQLRAKAPKLRGYPENPSTLGEHLKKRRMDLGLLQREVADRIGTNEATVTNWERGRTAPALQWMPRIIDFLGIPCTPSRRPSGAWVETVRRNLGVPHSVIARRIGIDPGNPQPVAAASGGMSSRRTGRDRVPGSRPLLDMTISSPRRFGAPPQPAGADPSP